MKNEREMLIRSELDKLKKQVERLANMIVVQNSSIATLNRQLESMKRPLPKQRAGKNGKKPLKHDLLDRLQAFQNEGISAAEMIKLVQDKGYNAASIRATLSTARSVGQVRFEDGRYYPIGLQQFEF